MRLLRWPSRKHLIKFIKYALAGGVAATAELSLLHFLTDQTALWYIYASVCASTLGFSISFTLRKLWVFKQHGTKGLGRQLTIYAGALGIVILLSTSIMALLVEHLHFPYVLAQFLAGLCTGLVGFVINTRFTFRQPQTLWERLDHDAAHLIGRNRL